MLQARNTIISALPALKPTLITNNITGEILTVEHLNQNLNKLITSVKTMSENYYQAHRELIEENLTSYTGKMRPAEYARTQGWSFPSSTLPREVKAKSRIERLTRYHLVQTVTSYILNPNPNPHKKPPGFGLTINLGAVDNQMVKLELIDNQLILTFKCWTEEYALYFTIPDYVLKRNILKFTLPTIRLNKQNEWVFGFAVQENTTPRATGNHSAGLDLGRVEPYTLVIINPTGARIADYKSNGRLNQLNLKRERLLQEKKHLTTKISAYQQLGLNIETLTTERNFKRNKITRLATTVANLVGAEVTKKLAKHNVNILNLENLTWVTGAKYGSKWNHSTQQTAITHSLARAGIKVKKVNPYNTSQKCHKCETKIIHNTKKRTVHCTECKTTLNRDFNAAMNIAKNRNKNAYSSTSVRTSMIVAPDMVQVIVANSNKAVNTDKKLNPKYSQE